jgi:hypothetical protein
MNVKPLSSPSPRKSPKKGGLINIKPIGQKKKKPLIIKKDTKKRPDHDKIREYIIQNPKM